MSFGVYVHIPYCRQICPYCDFSKYEIGKTIPPEEYAGLVRAEIRARSRAVPTRDVDAIYFGGGTPTAIAPELILSILDELANEGFRRSQSCEMTIEIDPETIDAEAIKTYASFGFNRYSVGVQSFNDRLLKIAGRQHDGAGAARALTLLAQAGVNYSFDLLFALPTQTLAELELDVRTALAFGPSHVSAYCLTLPDTHPMQRGRAPDDEQAAMFAAIDRELERAGLLRYELANFAKPGRESRHNSLYWTDQPYWGIGVSAHSYLPLGSFGTRFWNPPTMQAYARQAAVPGNSWTDWLSADQTESLLQHQALTDFAHTSLRLTRGLISEDVQRKFGPSIAALLEERAIIGESKGWFERTARGWRLSDQGRLLANPAFELVAFLADELPPG